MKNRLKGLLSLWLAVMMLAGMIVLPVQAQESRTYYTLIWTGEEAPDTSEYTGPESAAMFAEFEANAAGLDNSIPLLMGEENPINNQQAIMDVVDEVGSGRTLIGWEIYNYYPSIQGPYPVWYRVYINDPVLYIEASAYEEDGWIVLRPIFADHRINPQPTTGDPTAVGQTWNGTDGYADDEGATYQWYEYLAAEFDIVDSGEVDKPDSEIEGEGREGDNANYEFENTDNTWTVTWRDDLVSGAVFYVDFNAQKTDTIKVTFCNGDPVEEESQMVGYDYSNTHDFFAFVKNEDGSYTYDVTADGEYSVDLNKEQTDFKEGYNAAEESITFKISLLKNVLVQGETESTLSLTEEENGKKYICKVTFEDGTVLWSDPVEYQHPEDTGDTGNTGEDQPGMAEPTFDYGWWQMSVRAMMMSQHNIVASAGEGGAISPAGTTKVRFNMNQTYTITPAAGMVITDVLVDGVSVGAVSEYTFKHVTEPHTIHAVFGAAE